MESIYLNTLAFSAGGQGSLLDVNPGLIFWTVITFIFLFLILKKMAWKPILTSLDEREKLIRESLEKAEKAREDAEKLIQENQANFAKAEIESQKIIDQGREYAEKLKAQLLEDSKLEAKKMIDSATEEIERKNKEAFNNLRESVASIAIDAAEKIIRESLDKEKQKTLVNKYLEDLSKN
ncbi:MAG: F0F1 ATP synthase subunit B [Melioribacteraceae bacterium]|nr:F0F1 ATP synthase subunit B [Melioribacteraceae bacterium]MCF8264642.1 F0F1 ATP synthase subunit B [Melioribacteraceae bacterium]MCF8411984.1 F0F1 ATP synthase subunit B [Melioribacteraceae bacterium]MCF8431604.1 F0F1 ATP synthase subunit B [Melioribacteraceae bacterium]